MARKPANPPADKGEGLDPESLGLGTAQPVDPAGTAENDAQQTGTAPADPPPAEAPRKRGRPPGSGKKTGTDGPQKSSTRKAADTADLGRQIVGLHALIAVATQMPEMQITDAEGEMLARGVTAVAEEYGLALTGKTGAAIQLFAAAGMVYVPRLVMIKAKLAAQRAAQAAADEARTVDGSGLVSPSIHGADYAGPTH